MLSLPIKVRWVLARRPALVGRVLAVFLRALSTWQRRRGRALGVEGATGTVTFVQRFGSALQLNILFHAVVPDGMFVPGANGAVSFARLPPPSDEDVERLLERTVIRVLRMLKGALGDAEPEVDALVGRARRRWRRARRRTPSPAWVSRLDQRKALEVWGPGSGAHRERWRHLQRNGMDLPFGWKRRV